MAAAVDPKGLKRICPSCGTRYYDLNKRPIICPGCTVEFKTELKTKARRGRLTAANDRPGVMPDAVVAPKANDENIEVVEAEEDVVSLEEVADMEEGEDDDDADSADLGTDIVGDDDLEEDEAVVKPGDEDEE